MQETVKYRDRKNTDCEKWDGLKEQFGKAELLPAWVADMDFEAPACVQEALRKYVDFNVYGYYKVPEDYWQSFISWERKYHSYQVEKEWIRFVPGGGLRSRDASGLLSVFSCGRGNRAKADSLPSALQGRCLRDGYRAV